MRDLPQDETISIHKNWWIRISELQPTQQMWAWDELFKIAFAEQYSAPLAASKDRQASVEQKVRYAIFRDYAPFIRADIETQRKAKILEVKKLLEIVNASKKKGRRPGRPRKDSGESTIDMFCGESEASSPCTDLIDAEMDMPRLDFGPARQEDSDDTELARQFQNLDLQEEATSKYSRSEIRQMMSNLRYLNDDEEKRSRLNEMFKSGQDIARFLLDENGKIPCAGIIPAVGRALTDKDAMAHVYERFIASSWENPQHRVASSIGEFTKSVAAIVFNYEKQKKEEAQKRLEEEKKRREEEEQRMMNLSDEEIAEIQTQRRAALERD